MRKLIILLSVLIVTQISAQAQESYPRVEIFGGYSYLNSDQFFERENLGMPGFNVSMTGNSTRNIGLTAQVSCHYGNITIPSVAPIQQSPEFDANTFTYLAGPRFTVRGGTFNVFVHSLFGV